MKYEEVKIGMLVEDTWYWDWGVGTVIKKTSTRVQVHFMYNNIVTYDLSHLKFLKEK